VVKGAIAQDFLHALKEFPLCQHAAIIGEVAQTPAGKVLMKSGIGGSRVVNYLTGEQLPRIC
jgi:hydrogenase expression/formation protein HypE